MDTFKQIIEIFSGFLSPITAAGVLYIAYRQWKGDEKEKARKEIEKRIDIYKVVSEHLSHVDRTLKLSPELYDRFRIAHCEAKFYFSSAVIKFLDRIDSNSHQWMLEFNDLKEKGENDSSALRENLDELTSCSKDLDSKVFPYVLNGSTPH